MNVAYTYWTPIESEEHFLTSQEIAQMYGILTTRENPHSRMCMALMKKHCEEMEYPLFYYGASKGNMVAVFPSIVYQTVMEQVLEELEKGTSMEVLGTNYSYVLKKA